MPKLRQARAATATVLLAAGTTLLAGCAVHSHPAPRPHRHQAVRVTIAAGHVHTARCGHYRHRGHWYHLRGHHHGPRCGHRLVGGVWILRR